MTPFVAATWAIWAIALAAFMLPWAAAILAMAATADGVPEVMAILAMFAILAFACALFPLLITKLFGATSSSSSGVSKSRLAVKSSMKPLASK